jgi:2-oxoisovalerate dehydrogenase E2 component (dihydrolipoyl transacylase)
MALRPFVLADIGEGIKECEVIQWFVEPGATIEEFDPICEVQSDKASVEITSRFSGVIKQLHYNVGDMALVGKPLVDIDVVGEEASATQPEPSRSVDQQQPIETPSPISATPKDPHLATLATPAVRRLCRELNVDIRQVAGSGKGGRVMKEDVMRFSQGGRREELPYQEPTPVVSSPVAPTATVTPLTPIQKQMFKTMTNSLNIPHFLYTDEVELEKVGAVRKAMNDELASQGIKLSFMPFFLKALSLSLLKYPVLNSRVTFENNIPALVSRPIHNIGVAMDTPNGLIVPNIKDVGRLSIVQIGQELNRLQQLGATGKLSAADLKDGTITLSNIGTVGGTYLGPVIVESEVAIGGLGKARTLPRYDSNMNLVPKTILNTSWSGDHRVIDGVTMAKMVAQWKAYVEQPEKMLMHLK